MLAQILIDFFNSFQQYYRNAPAGICQGVLLIKCLHFKLVAIPALNHCSFDGCAILESENKQLVLREEGDVHWLEHHSSLRLEIVLISVSLECFYPDQICEEWNIFGFGEKLILRNRPVHA